MDETRDRSKRNAAWPPPLDAFQQRMGEMLRASPAGDIERNMKALAAQFFGRLDLVTRDDYEDLLAVVERLSARVTALERAAGTGPGAPVGTSPGTPGAPDAVRGNRHSAAADPGGDGAGSGTAGNAAGTVPGQAASGGPPAGRSPGA